MADNDYVATEPTGERSPPTPAAPLASPNLGKYYTSLRLYEYKRPNMFSTSIPNLANVIYLPLPDGLRDSSTADWQETQQGALASIFMNAQGAGGSRDMAAGLKSALGAAAVGSLPGQAGEAVKSLAGSLPVIGDISKAVLDNLFPAEALNAFVQQSFYGGMAQNPNPTVIFKGPTLRGFDLGWTFTPRSKSESENTKKIIELIKQWSLPTPHFGNTMATLSYPGLAMINFMPWDNLGAVTDARNGWTENSIIKYKVSAIKSVNVNYAPSNVPAFYADGNNPAIITMNISFQEVEYMVSKDWGGRKSYFAGVAGAPNDPLEMGWGATKYIATEAYNAVKAGIGEFNDKLAGSVLTAGATPAANTPDPNPNPTPNPETPPAPAQ